MYNKNIVELIYLQFKNVYGFPQGYCGQIAEAIQKEIGGELVAGYLSFNTHTREHWWVELDNEIIDPMSDELMLTDKHRHVEVHRDISKKYW